MNHTLLQKYLDKKEFPHYTDEEIAQVQEYLLEENFERQMCICMEEISELTKEITKTLRGKRNSLGLEEEVADVLITLKILSLMPNKNRNNEINLDKYEIGGVKLERKHLLSYIDELHSSINTISILLLNLSETDEFKYPSNVNKLRSNIDIHQLIYGVMYIAKYFHIDIDRVRDIIDIKINEANKRIKLINKTEKVLTNYFDSVDSNDNLYDKIMKDPYLSYNNFINRIIEEFNKYKSLIIALDFDDTINDFHKKGYTYDYIIDLLKWYADNNYAKIVIFTASKEDRYPEIENKCKEIGLKIEGINIDLIEGQGGRKIYANVFVDDRAGLGYSYKALYRLYEKITENKNNKILHT